MQNIHFKLQGLHCEACVKISSMKFKKIAGVKEVTIDQKTGDVVIVADRRIGIEELKQAIKDTEYIIN